MKNIEVIPLINCLAWMEVLVRTTPSQSKNTVNMVLILLWLCHTFFWHGELGNFHCIIPKNLLNHLNNVWEGMGKLNAKFDAYLLLYWLSHFECTTHSYTCLLIHMLTQWCLLPPLTSTVKLSLFMHVHSCPFSLSARLHGCHTNCFCYINNGWTSSGKTSYTKRALGALKVGAQTFALT